MASVTIKFLNGDQIELFGDKVTLAAVKIAAANKMDKFPPEITICLENGDPLAGADEGCVFERPGTPPIVTTAVFCGRDKDDAFWDAAMDAYVIAGDINGASVAASQIPTESLGGLLGMRAGKGCVETVNVLLGAGANVNHEIEEHDEDGDFIVDEDGDFIMGRTALNCASRHGHLETVNALLDAGANVEHETQEGVTALIYASRDGHLETVNVLLGAGANVEHETQEGVTALIYASQDGHLETVNALLDAGANVEHEAREGVTALICASDEGHLETVNALLDAGANVEHEAQEGVTALICASVRGHLGIVNALKKKR